MDLIDRQAAIDALCKAGCGSKYCGISCDDVKAIEDLPSAQPSFPQRHENDCINRQDAIDAIRDNESENYITINNLIDKDVAVALLENLPSAQSESEDITFWKKRAREYEEMVLKLIDEMARGIKINSVLITEEGIVFKKEKPERRWIPCGKCIHADGKHRWCKVLDRTINEDYFCYWAEPFREEGENDG